MHEFFCIASPKEDPAFCPMSSIRYCLLRLHYLSVHVSMLAQSVVVFHANVCQNSTSYLFQLYADYVFMNLYMFSWVMMIFVKPKVFSADKFPYLAHPRCRVFWPRFCSNCHIHTQYNDCMPSTIC